MLIKILIHCRHRRELPAAVCAAAACMFLAALLLTGCVKKYGRGDIASYAKKLSRAGSSVSTRMTDTSAPRAIRRPML